MNYVSLLPELSSRFFDQGSPRDDHVVGRRHFEVRVLAERQPHGGAELSTTLTSSVISSFSLSTFAKPLFNKAKVR